MSIFIGIDSGTQSTKGIALDLTRGRVVAEARAPHRLIAGLPPGHMEQHPQDWTRALDRVLRALASRIDASRVRGIGVSGQQHGFVPLDGDGHVIRPAKLWCDTSTAAECADLTAQLGGARAVMRETGLPFLPGYTAPKILWLKKHEPAHWRRLRHVLLPHDYLNFFLTGAYTMEFGDASGTALMDVCRRRWSPRVLAAIDRELGDFLPELTSSTQRAGPLLPKLARRYGFPDDVIVSAGGGDNMMGAIGSGNVAPGVVTCSLGTSGTIYAYSRQPIVDPAGEIAAFCDSTDAWLPLLCTMNVTVVTEQVRQLFAWDHRELERAAAAAPAGAEGLLLLPYLDGERTPNLPGATATLAGLTRETLSPNHFARAAMEGVALGLNYGLVRLRDLGVAPREIRLIGGGAKSPVWRQILADVFGVPVVKMALDESAALGGALQAAALDRHKLVQLCHRFVSLDERTRVHPNRANHLLHREQMKRHDTLRAALYQSRVH